MDEKYPLRKAAWRGKEGWWKDRFAAEGFLDRALRGIRDLADNIKDEVGVNVEEEEELHKKGRGVTDTDPTDTSPEKTGE